MTKFNYAITIEAASKAEADTKMKALTILASSLSTKELDKLGWIVKNDPIKTALAKKALGV
ncbi:MAG TPA: hypothetical protein VK808_06875 [Bacteroidia bacterium]|jgi:hypothetical protein|nr:hypothetical protein [Bacteroidia bacterium]